MTYEDLTDKEYKQQLADELRTALKKEVDRRKYKLEFVDNDTKRFATIRRNHPKVPESVVPIYLEAINTGWTRNTRNAMPYWIHTPTKTRAQTTIHYKNPASLARKAQEYIEEDIERRIKFKNRNIRQRRQLEKLKDELYRHDIPFRQAWRTVYTEGDMELKVFWEGDNEDWPSKLRFKLRRMPHVTTEEFKRLQKFFDEEVSDK